MTKQRGNILFLILLAIILFVALTYAVNSGMNGSGKSGGAESAKSAAASILNNATMMQQAVNRIMLTNGCKETELSFEDPYDNNYVNNARADGSCKLFGDKGGGLEYPVPDSNWLDKSQTSVAPNFFGKWYFSNNVCVLGVSTGGVSDCWNNGTVTDNELIAFLPFLKKDVCQAINNEIGIAMVNDDVVISGGGSVDYQESRKFTGTFQDQSTQQSRWIGQGASGFISKYHGCFQRAVTAYVPSGDYVFYMVLLAR